MPVSARIKNEFSTHFEALFRHASMGILVTDNSGQIIAINPFALKEFGYSEKEIIGKKTEMLIPPRFREKHSSQHENYLKEGQSRPMSAGISAYALTKDGTELPVEISLSSYKTSGDTYVIAFIRNISVRRKAEEEIQKLKDQLEAKVEKRTLDLKKALKQHEVTKAYLEKIISFQKAIVDNAGAMIIATDAMGVIKLFNPEACFSIGYEEDEVINKMTPVLFHDMAEINRKRQELFYEYGITINNPFDVMVEKPRRNIHEENQYTYIRKDGTSFPVLLTITAIRNFDGEITDFLGIAIDISERKKADEELKNVQALFLQLLGNYPDGSISIIDKNCNIIYTGGELFTRLDTDAKKLIGRKIYSKFPETLRPVIQAILDNVFKNKSIFSDFELPLPLGGKIYVMDAFPLVEEDGSVNKAGVIIRNISELKKAKENLIISLKKEKELGELKSRFVSMASHEFRTPLSTVLSSAYLIEKYTGSEDQSRREKHIQRIVSSVNMLTDILNDFLSVGKIEEGKIQVRFTEFNVREEIEEMLNEFRDSLKKHQKIEYHHGGNPVVALDLSLLKHIVMNLVSNASKFSYETSLIEIKTSIDNHQLTLSVKDHGIGISESDQKHLMERFFRGANAGNIQGTGLGLHIVAKYAELMNGTVKCISELERGTEFIVTFDKKNT